MLASAFAVILSGCCCDVEYKESPASLYTEPCVDYQFEIARLPYDELVYTNYRPRPVVDSAKPHDSLGVLMYRPQNGDPFYQPVEMCAFALQLVDLYHRTHEAPYLEMLTRYLDRMKALAVTYDSAVYFAYERDQYVHGTKEMPLTAPWYSGMAQGLILGLFTRTYVATGDTAYLVYADSIFNSLLRLRGEADPWVVFVDDEGCFWIEEYPVDPPTKTLNGFIFAMYGLYDYYRITDNPVAGDVLQATLSTLKNRLPAFRQKGKSSLYELRTGHVDQNYHFVHIGQLRYLNKITGDPFFTDWADSLASDLPERR